MRRFLVLLVLGLVIAAAPASADDRGFYLGLGFGIPSFDAGEFYPEFDGLRFEDNTFGLKAFGGYRILKYLAVEVTYTNYGEFTKHETSTTAVDEELKVGIHAFDASAVGVIPVGKKTALFAKVGFASWNADVRATADGVTQDLSRDGTDLTFGLGIDFLIKKVGIRIEGDWLEMADTSGAFLLTGNLTYHF